MFPSALDVTLTSNDHPDGFGLHEEYEPLESHKTQCSSKPLVVPLPYDMWFTQIVVWCKAMDLLKCL